LIPISTLHIFALFLLTASLFFIILFSVIRELKKPKDAGPRKILESDGKEIVGFSVLLAVYFRENSHEAKVLEDIETPELTLPNRSFLSIPLPDIEF